jgi:electron transport complex protein RnfB
MSTGPRSVLDFHRENPTNHFENPSLDEDGPATARAFVRIGACQGCGACLLTCPAHAIRPAGGILTVRDDLCTGCLECIEVCPVDAIEETP